jgi:hypothetical protein
LEEALMGYTSRKLLVFSSVKGQAANQVIDPRWRMGGETRFSGLREK